MRERRLGRIIGFVKIHDIVFVYHLREANLLNWHSRIHSHPDNYFEFHYFLSGDGRFRNGNAVYGIEKGQLFFTWPNQIHAIQPGLVSDPLSYYAVLFEMDARDLPQVDLSDPVLAKGFPLSVGPGHRLRFEDMKNRYNSANQYYKLSAQFELLSFLFDLLGRIDESDTEIRQGREGSSEVYVEQAMDLFQRNIFGNLRLSEIATQLRISEEYLIRLFRRTVGITPMRYYQNLKLEASISLLLNTTQSIKEISYQLGFSSQYHFSRNFKNFSRVSPSDYRTRYFHDNPTNYQTKIVG